MRGTAMIVNIDAVRLVMNHMRIGTQRVKYRLCDRRSGTIGTIKRDFLALEGTGCQRNQITDITVTAGCKIHRTANVFACRKRNLRCQTIQIVLNFLNYIIAELLTVSIDDL